VAREVEKEAAREATGREAPVATEAATVAWTARPRSISIN